MCQYCAESEVWGEPFEPEDGEDEEEYQCEWIEGPEEEEDDAFDEEDEEEAELNRCLEPPAHVVFERYVDEHFCAQHKAAYERDLEEGLGALLEEAGLQEEVEFLPIPVGEDRCDYVDPRDLLRPAGEVEECAAPAAFARRIVTSSLLCDEHAEEAGYTPGRHPEAT